MKMLMGASRTITVKQINKIPFSNKKERVMRDGAEYVLTLDVRCRISSHSLLKKILVTCYQYPR
jgi:hypothetical protein